MGDARQLTEGRAEGTAEGARKFAAALPSHKRGRETEARVQEARVQKAGEGGGGKAGKAWLACAAATLHAAAASLRGLWSLWSDALRLAVRSHPGYFGKVGMRYFHKTQNKFFRPVINVDKLWTLVSEQTRTRYASDPDGKAPVIDCVRSVRTLPAPPPRHPLAPAVGG